MKNRIIIFIALLALTISCEKAPTSPENTETGDTDEEVGKRGPYVFIADETILALDWNDKRKQDYFYTNWMNTITNQTITPAGVTPQTRKTDEKGNYYDEKGQLAGEFQYVTNVKPKKGNNTYIGALYKDPRRPKDDSKWMIFRVAEDGTLYNLSGFGTGATGDTPPTEEIWNKTMNKWGDAPLGTIKLD